MFARLVRYLKNFRDFRKHRDEFFEYLSIREASRERLSKDYMKSATKWAKSFGPEPGSAKIKIPNAIPEIEKIIDHYNLLANDLDKKIEYIDYYIHFLTKRRAKLLAAKAAGAVETEDEVDVAVNDSGDIVVSNVN